MCGVVAALLKPGATLGSRDLQPALDRMARRGPDASGLWRDDAAVLGHRRLAILDLDARAHQPMLSACGRYAITFNGEIYNFRELRSALEKDGVSFRTTCDTEVLLVLFAREGAAMLPRLRGMFAFVIWDGKTQKAFAARDPYGIKPLYYASTREATFFASQVKALLATGKVSRTPDPRGQAAFWLLGSVAEPHTWFREIRALPAGHCVWVERGVCGTPQRWWEVSAAWREAPFDRADADEVCDRVRSALRSSVEAHLVSDVPIGIFLSGGIDSGALAGLLAEAGRTDVQGVTLGFPEFIGHENDETLIAARIARHYGIRHHVRTVTRDEFAEDLPRIIDAMDQPSIDGVNTWYASKAVAELGLKVALSGVGGDELFQGYSTFRRLPRLVRTWGLLSQVPGAKLAADAAAGLMDRRTGNHRWRAVPAWSRSLPGAWWLARGLYSPSDLPALMGDGLFDAVDDVDPDAWIAEMTGSLARDPRLALSQIESTTYLRNQLLRDSDWASMDHSVELRTPLVDAWLLREVQPVLTRFGAFDNKSLLAEAPASPLPPEVARRRKTGFGVPMSRWLDGAGGKLTGGGGSRAWSRQLVSSYEAAPQPILDADTRIRLSLP